MADGPVLPPLSTAAPPERGGARSTMDVDARMVALTWLAFVLALVILQRIGWKPMLRALARREGHIRGALDEAEKTRQAAAAAREAQAEAARQAEAERRRLLDEARRHADALARSIEQDAREAARREMEAGRADVARQQEKSLEILRGEAAQIAAAAAARILAARADDDGGALDAWLAPPAERKP